MSVAVLESASLKSSLYASADCRVKLFGVLHALVISPHHLCPPPLQYAATVFSLAQIRDTNPVVRDVCGVYLRSIEKILHPQKDVLSFAPEVNDVRDALKEIFQNSSAAPEDSSDEEVRSIDLSVCINFNLVIGFRIWKLTSCHPRSQLSNYR